MIFEIDRSSVWSIDPDNSPAEGAVFVKPNGDRRYGYWAMEFNTLQDILDFMEKEKEDIIITRNGRHAVPDRYPPYCIEIYDDYRE